MNAIVKEMIDCRTECSKTYEKSNGKRITSIKTAPQHYRQFGGFHDLQHNIITASPRWCNYPIKQLIGNKTMLRLGDEPATTFQDLAYFSRLCDTEYGSDEYYFSLALKDIPCDVNRWIQLPGQWNFLYPNIVDGADIKISLSPTGYANWKLAIKSVAALRKLVDDDNCINLTLHFPSDLLTFDEEKYTLKNKPDISIFKIGKPFITIFNGNIELERLENDAIELNLDEAIINGRHYILLKKRILDMPRLEKSLKKGFYLEVDPAVSLPDSGTSADNWFYSHYPLKCYGTDTNIRMGYVSTYSYFCALIFSELSSHFNLQNADSIDAARLKLSTSYTHNDLGDNVNLEIFRILVPWVEGVSSSNPTIGSNFIKRDIANNLDWNDGGCNALHKDFDTAVLGEIIMNGKTSPAGTVFTGEFCSKGVLVLTDMINGVYNNYGITIRPAAGETTGCYASSTQNTIYPVPELLVEYTSSLSGIPYFGSESSASTSLIVGNIPAEISISPLSGIQDGDINLTITVKDKQVKHSEVLVAVQYREDEGDWLKWEKIENGKDFIVFDSFKDYSQSKPFTFDSLTRLSNGNRFSGSLSLRAHIIHEDGSDVEGDKDEVTCTVNNRIIVRANPIEQVIGTPDSFYLYGVVERFNRSPGQVYTIEVSSLIINETVISGFPKDTHSNSASFEMEVNNQWVPFNEDSLKSGMKFRYIHNGDVAEDKINSIEYTFKAYEVS